MPRAPAHCMWKGHSLYGHLNIPQDTRHAFGGKKQFMVPLHTSDPVEAAAKVGPMVREWKARIKAVRAGLHDPQRDQIDKLAAEFRKLHSPLDDAGARLVANVIDFVFRQVGGMTALEQHTALTHARGDVLQALQAAPQATRAVNAMQQIAGACDAHTPFLTHAENWRQRCRRPRHGGLEKHHQGVRLRGLPAARTAGRQARPGVDRGFAGGQEEPAHCQVQAGSIDRLLEMDGEP